LSDIRYRFWATTEPPPAPVPSIRAGKVARLIKRLRVHGLIERVGRTCEYYLAALGRRARLARLHIRAVLLTDADRRDLTADGRLS
jgi:hypothetical protein